MCERVEHQIAQIRQSIFISLLIVHADNRWVIQQITLNHEIGPLELNNSFQQFILMFTNQLKNNIFFLKKKKTSGC